MWTEACGHPLYKTEHDGWNLETTMNRGDGDTYHWIVSASRGNWRHVCKREFEFPSDALTYMRKCIDCGRWE